MWELYLLTRLDGINIIFGIILSLGVIAGIITLGCYVNNQTKYIKTIISLSVITIVIGTIGLVFTPTTKEGLLILGVGQSIDYLKSNEIVKQLPDKCINALNNWVDNFTEENKRKESN